MSALHNRRILLGVTGGIAAYKSAELVRRLRGSGAQVRVVMSQAAGAFVSPLTFQALSGHPVRSELFDAHAEAAMGHIELARWAELVLVAPATADFLARLACGLADDLLSTLCLAAAVPIWLAPAMNQAMWSAPATRANCALLASRGVVLLGPAEGEQACGEVGPGRMLEPAALSDHVVRHFQAGPLSGRRCLVTAGPTREAIDPVRFIGNRSSGKMGYALAEAARDAGARVILVSGPVALTAPAGIERILVTTAEEMCAQVLAHVPVVDLLIAAAAVADYRPVETLPQKRKKEPGPWLLRLEPTVDILATVAALPARPFTVGFAAETHALEQHARDKLVRKKLDLVAANDVGGADLGFEVDDNALRVFWADGETDLGRAPKTELARRLIATIAERLHAQGAA